MPTKNLASIQELLFDAPLYTEYKLKEVSMVKAREDGPRSVSDIFNSDVVVDGHCVECAKTSTFIRTGAEVSYSDLLPLAGYAPCQGFVLTCTRVADHQIFFIFRIEDNIIQKIGQYPSLADIANDEARIYRQVVDARDSAEIHRAIGLAAHGVGVGSFVYLRRVFERMISRRFQEYKDAEGWNPTDFARMRMDEKIELLERHLPEFLVRNSKIYAILSKGLHELDEDECLSAFEMVKQAIFFILDQDRHKKEELERRKAAEKAIAAFPSAANAGRKT
jgi:hypothetical protein